MESSVKTRSQTSVIYPLLGFLVATVLFQVATSWWGAPQFSKYAGPARGDRLFAADVVPDSVAGWTRTRFTAPNEDEAKGSIGWSHAWQMQQNQQIALVSFDQVGFMGWHELTQCYCATGWMVAERENKSVSTQNAWDYVQCLLEKPSGEKAILLYSIFNGEAEPVTPPTVTIQDTLRESLLTRRNTSSSGKTVESGRCLQAQVLVPVSSEVNDDLRQSILQLHLETRELFRTEWRQKSGENAHE